MHHVVKGFSDVLLNFTYTSEEHDDVLDLVASRYKRQAQQPRTKPTSRPRWVEPKSPYELRLEAQRRQLRKQRGGTPTNISEPTRVMPEMVMPPIINLTTEQVINQRPINITSTSQPVPVPVNLPQRPQPQALSQMLPLTEYEDRLE
ncbi:hypothetical protein RvY_17211 [Ramazzottius varieornatus]|uniref:Uncharacterized protein n=1 Tax=Ramazzottius varieornatus TaxID=947166 RepID=A0A1D1W1C5_RAMVA|nr:hypothetical protein RvY_17211 [Ramazzottius varieornatus]